MPLIITEGVMAIAFSIFIYWALRTSLDKVAVAIFAQYTMSAYPAMAWTFVSALISSFPVILFIGINLWMVYNAKQRDFGE